MKTVLQFLRNDQGTETVEWAIVIGLIAVGAIALAAEIGTHVYNAFNNLETQFEANPPGALPGGA